MATQYVIKRGDLGIGVNKLQAYLNMMQQRNLISTVNKQDGVFGPLTETAVREWQRYAGLPIDGIINYHSLIVLCSCYVVRIVCYAILYLCF